MVQRKAHNKLGIKPHLLKLDTQLVNLTPSSSSSSSSSQSYEKLKKIMKKSRPIKRPSDESPFRKKKTPGMHDGEPVSKPATPQKRSPNYMKSTSSFEARKEQSPRTPITQKNSKTNESASGVKGSGSRTSSLKMMRVLTKTPSFKPIRSSKKVILCEEDVDSQRATCSSILKESKFPDYLQLNPGGTELDGTSAMKVCPYSYCSLNGHHHAPVPPLKCFLQARRRGLKTQKGFKLGCLSPRKKPDVKAPVILDREEEENRGFFIDIYSENRGSKSGDDLECSEMDWEEGCCSDSGNDGFKLQKIDDGVAEDQIGLYDEESVSSGAWSDEDGDSASDGSYQQMKIDQDYVNYESFDVSSTASESDVNDEIDELQGQNLPIGDRNIDYQQEETSQNRTTRADFAEKLKDGVEKNQTTIIYNIIQFNISVFINGERTGDSERDTTVIVQEPATSVDNDGMETGEAMEEQGMSSEEDEASEVNQMVADEELPFNVEEIASTKQLNANDQQDDHDHEQECNEFEASSQSNSMDVIANMDEEPAIRSDLDQTDIKMDSFCKKNPSNEEIDNDSLEFNPRGPNFLPETPDPDAETVDLRHQMIDERKNAEEWMVDFALQQAVTTLAPARKRKVALLVEAFEKVMPDPVPVRVPMYETSNRHTSKAFTNSRPMQACS